MKLKKKHFFIGLIIIFLIVLLITIFGEDNKKRTIVRLKGVSVVEPIKDFNINNKSVFIWADPVLYISDKEGNILKKVQTDGEDVEAYFSNNYAFLYEKDLGKVQIYSEMGEPINTVKINGEIFNISYENANMVFHVKDGDKEKLLTLQNDTTLTEVYETGNQILTHDISSEDKYSVAELVTHANGYTSVVYRVDGNNKYKKELAHEIVMFINNAKNSTLFLTDQKLYRLIDDEKIYAEDVPNISDIFTEGRKTYILHSGIITEYNYKLKETDKHIIAANVNHMTSISGSIYVYGPSDIGGEIGTSGEFYTRLGYSLDKMQINGLTIGALRNGELNFYKVTSTNLLQDKDAQLDTNYIER